MKDEKIYCFIGETSKGGGLRKEMYLSVSLYEYVFFSSYINHNTLSYEYFLSFMNEYGYSFFIHETL